LLEARDWIINVIISTFSQVRREMRLVLCPCSSIDGRTVLMPKTKRIKGMLWNGCFLLCCRPFLHWRFWFESRQGHDYALCI